MWTDKVKVKSLLLGWGLALSHGRTFVEETALVVSDVADMFMAGYFDNYAVSVAFHNWGESAGVVIGPERAHLAIFDLSPKVYVIHYDELPPLFSSG
jgi:hypothetical protein